MLLLFVVVCVVVVCLLALGAAIADVACCRCALPLVGC